MLKGYREYRRSLPPKVKKNISFSKKILIVSWVSGSLITIYGLWLTYLMVVKGYHGDVSIVLTVLGGAFAEISAATSFYLWKEKNENINKQQLNPDYLKLEMGEDFGDEYID
ncbi:hypothetical protein OXB_2813 [Bacillus sp. OxB-1]|uniref:hypothetical protein n=1 Tax=Bacillus sp. (strain OxB-1) TaxID=98228 RepID=UPI000581D269|nr:hypothetical protein [Bacillus sp. OxB-1]BAQ11284.1 hypothetical protein OXB_2813 [Bacillus sp. OxB-1]